MPESLFKISGKGGTHTKTCLLLLQKKVDSLTTSNNTTLFMAEAKWCGHDSRGRQINHDELPEIARNYHQYLQGKPLANKSHLGYSVAREKIVTNILAPRYYNPSVDVELSILEDSHDLVNIGDLVSSGVIEIVTGDEVGKLAYGTGNIPFVRTSDISNWEIKVDPKHFLLRCRCLECGSHRHSPKQYCPSYVFHPVLRVERFLSLFKSRSDNPNAL